jgi:hypothetical protein
MNYQYHSDGTTTRYTINGTDYYKLEDIPEEHRAYFERMDKNKNGVPDNVEGLLDAMNGPSGKTSFRKVIGTLFKVVGENIAKNDFETTSFEEVKEVKEIKTETVNTTRPIEEPRHTYNQGNVVQRGESSFIPTLVKVLVAAVLILAALWFLGVIK